MLLVTDAGAFGVTAVRSPTERYCEESVSVPGNLRHRQPKHDLGRPLN